MTASEAGRPESGAAPVRLVPEASAPAEVITHPMPRLGRGIVWSDIVAEIERDREERMRDAA
ncbi:DUF6222 family protein [Amycolatopsis sp. CA-128772]|uniref:DUF6222 family protein n=1 Tax=Amycolatopsis sp. CA-128772 TaxID=2073159 RepID=UPI000CD2CAD0|nr:DUF6222 family protein [Amycolatopsis sp. CA-128772]